MILVDSMAGPLLACSAPALLCSALPLVTSALVVTGESKKSQKSPLHITEKSLLGDIYCSEIFPKLQKKVAMRRDKMRLEEGRQARRGYLGISS